MWILNVIKSILIIIVFLKAGSVYGDIPSAKGDNYLALGTGFPGILNGSMQLFCPLGDRFGMCVGGGGTWSWYEEDDHYYALLRVHNDNKQSLGVFLEKNRVEQAGFLSENRVIISNAYGIAYTKVIQNGTLDMALSISNNPKHIFGIGTGFKITRDSGKFYGVSIIDGSFPTCFIGYRQRFATLISFEKTKSGEIRD